MCAAEGVCPVALPVCVQRAVGDRWREQRTWQWAPREQPDVQHKCIVTQYLLRRCWRSPQQYCPHLPELVELQPLPLVYHVGLVLVVPGMYYREVDCLGTVQPTELGEVCRDRSALCQVAVHLADVRQVLELQEAEPPELVRECEDVWVHPSQCVGEEAQHVLVRIL